MVPRLELTVYAEGNERFLPVVVTAVWQHFGALYINGGHTRCLVVFRDDTGIRVCQSLVEGTPSENCSGMAQKRVAWQETDTSVGR